MPEKKPDDVLAEAVTRNSAIVLSLPSAGMLRHHKSRFLSLVEEGFWVEGAGKDHTLLNELIATQAKVGVSFKTGTRMISFGSRILREDPNLRINASTTVEAILLERPAEIESLQRRSNYRVRVPANSALSVRVWRIPEHHVLRDSPLASLELRLEVADLSIGGMSVHLLPRWDEPIKASRDERLRIVLNYEGEQSLAEGRLRLPRDFDPNVKSRAGIAFKKLESNIEGRHTIRLLTRIVGDFQREEVRQRRLGLREAG